MEPDGDATGRRATSRREVERRVAFAEIALHNGSAETALREFEDVLAHHPAVFRDRARLGRAQAQEALGLVGEAAHGYEELAERSDPGGADWAERYMDVTRCYSIAGQIPAAIAVGERALSTFEALDLPWTDESIRLGVTLAGVQARHGDYLLASSLLRRLLRVADETGSPLARGSVLWNAAFTAAETGRYDEARRLSEKALAMLGEAGHRRNLAELRASHGRWLGLAEPAETARSLAIQQDAYEAMLEVSSPQRLSAQECDLADTALRLGDLDLALAYAQTALERVQSAGTTDEVVANVVVAEVFRAIGDDTAAEVAVRAAADLLPGLRWEPRSRASCWQRIAVLRRELGDTAGALDAYEEAMRILGYSEPVRRQEAAVEAAPGAEGDPSR